MSSQANVHRQVRQHHGHQHLLSNQHQLDSQYHNQYNFASLHGSASCCDLVTASSGGLNSSPHQHLQFWHCNAQMTLQGKKALSSWLLSLPSASLGCVLEADNAGSEVKVWDKIAGYHTFRPTPISGSRALKVCIPAKMRRAIKRQGYLNRSVFIELVVNDGVESSIILVWSHFPPRRTEWLDYWTTALRWVLCISAGKKVCWCMDLNLDLLKISCDREIQKLWSILEASLASTRLRMRLPSTSWHSHVIPSSQHKGQLDFLITSRDVEAQIEHLWQLSPGDHSIMWCSVDSVTHPVFSKPPSTWRAAQPATWANLRFKKASWETGVESLREDIRRVASTALHCRDTRPARQRKWTERSPRWHSLKKLLGAVTDNPRMWHRVRKEIRLEEEHSRDQLEEREWWHQVQSGREYFSKVPALKHIEVVRHLDQQLCEASDWVPILAKEFEKRWQSTLSRQRLHEIQDFANSVSHVPFGPEREDIIELLQQRDNKRLLDADGLCVSMFLGNFDLIDKLQFWIQKVLHDNRSAADTKCAAWCKGKNTTEPLPQQCRLLARQGVVTGAAHMWLRDELRAHLTKVAKRDGLNKRVAGGISGCSVQEIIWGIDVLTEVSQDAGGSWCCCQADIESFYDSIEHSTIIKSLSALQVPCHIIGACIRLHSQPKIVLVHGDVSQTIRRSRGLFTGAHSSSAIAQGVCMFLVRLWEQQRIVYQGIVANSMVMTSWSDNVMFYGDNEVQTIEQVELFDRLLRAEGMRLKAESIELLVAGDTSERQGQFASMTYNKVASFKCLGHWFHCSGARDIQMATLKQSLWAALFRAQRWWSVPLQNVEKEVPPRMKTFKLLSGSLISWFAGRLFPTKSTLVTLDRLQFNMVAHILHVSPKPGESSNSFTGRRQGIVRAAISRHCTKWSRIYCLQTARWNEHLNRTRSWPWSTLSNQFDEAWRQQRYGNFGHHRLNSRKKTGAPVRYQNAIMLDIKFHNPLNSEQITDNNANELHECLMLSSMWGR